MMLLQHPEVVYMGWGLSGDIEVLKDQLCLQTIEEEVDRVYSSPYVLQ